MISPDLKKQLRYRSWHRGTKEADLLMGGFADKYIDELSAHELELYQKLLNENDSDIMDWIFGKKPHPTYIPDHFIEKLRNL